MSNYIIANFDRKEYLRPEVFGEETDLQSVVTSYQGVLTALTVLLADGNGRGGGDLRADAEIIGSWAGSRIAIIDDTVLNAELCEPGMEHVPLQQQLRAMGRDVSGAVFEVIKKAEGEYWDCSNLNPKHTLSLPTQRKLPGEGGKHLLTAEGRLTKLVALEDFFAVFGVTMGITPYGAVRQFQKGLDTMAPAFGLVNDWDVLSVRFEMGDKPMRASRYDREKTKMTGVVGLNFELRDRRTGESHAFPVRLGSRGSTTADIYQRLFPSIQFEKAESLTSNLRSPEVAKLLANLKLDGIDNNDSKEA